LAHLIQGLGTLERQALLIKGAVVAFDKAILLWVMRVADEHGYSQGVTKAHEGSGKVTAEGVIPLKPRVPVQRDGGR